MLLASILALALAAEAPAGAAPAASPPVMAPMQQPSAQQFDITSKITGRTYRILVSRPAAPPPKEGYPVFYMLDGGVTFTVAQTRVLLSGSPPVVLVGVAYPDALQTLQLRNWDLTPGKPNAWSATRLAPGSTAADYGGADDFHRFMMEELRPAIAAAIPVNPKNQALMGYSLGGLFTLHVMFRHPEAYQTYVAGSPSIWWNEREVLKDEAGFEAAVRAGKVAPRILITSAGWEQSGGPDLPPAGKARDEALAQLGDARMVDNARELAARLGAVKGAAGYTVRYEVFADETHNSGVPSAANRGTGFVIAP
jgi:ferri-bacillibactin esterase